MSGQFFEIFLRLLKGLLVFLDSLFGFGLGLSRLSQVGDFAMHFKFLLSFFVQKLFLFGQAFHFGFGLRPLLGRHDLNGRPRVFHDLDFLFLIFCLTKGNFAQPRIDRRSGECFQQLGTLGWFGRKETIKISLGQHGAAKKTFIVQPREFKDLGIRFRYLLGKGVPFGIVNVAFRRLKGSIRFVPCSSHLPSRPEHSGRQQKLNLCGTFPALPVQDVLGLVPSVTGDLAVQGKSHCIEQSRLARSRPSDDGKEARTGKGFLVQIHFQIPFEGVQIS